MPLGERDLKKGVTGDDVKLLQAHMAGLGFQLAADEVARASYGTTTGQAVAGFQEAAGLAPTGVVDKATAAVIEKAAAASQQRFTVSGQVFSTNRAGVGSLDIRIVDKSVGPDTLLAVAKTDAAGRYTVEFGAESLAQLGKTVPDLQAQAWLGKKQLGASVVQYDAGAMTILDVELPATADSSLPSEHETLTRSVARLFKGGLRDLKEGDGRSDITYLANKTGWDARAVALAVLADQFEGAADGKVPASYFYALFRAGIPASADIAFHLRADDLTSIWKAAASDGVISAKDAAAIPDMTVAFRDLAAARLLTAPLPSGRSTFSDMLGLAGLAEGEQRQVASLYTTHEGDLSGFWKAVTKALGDQVAGRLQAHGKLAYLTLNNAPLMKRLDTIGDPLELVRQGYHTAAPWRKLVKADDVPAEIPGSSADEKLDNYAAYLAAQLRVSYPTAAIAQMVEAGQLKVDAAPAVSRFLADHQDRFNLTGQPIRQYLAQTGTQIDDEAAGEIVRLQRVLQMTPSDDSMAALLADGMDSAFRIVNGDRASFVATYADRIGGEVASRIYDRAVQIHHAVLNLTVSFLAAQTGPALGAMQIAAANDDATPTSGQFLDARSNAPSGADMATVIAYPTLESLFGSMDFCSCDECRSMLSPAAYLVDLLQFIDKAADGKLNAQDVLLSRRPDIQHLPLTCENTNTPIPYIDIVNETLEFYIANPAGPLSLSGFAGHDTGIVPSEDLLASPQFRMDDAYNKLVLAFFPAPLPFHRPLESLRQYFETFGVHLHRAMALLRQSDDLERGANDYGWRDICMETLGLSRPEYRLLTDSTLTLAEIYGFTAGTADADVITALSNARNFARRLGIGYDDLVAILQTRFVNPEAALIPKLSRLGVPFAALAGLHDGTLAASDFLALLPAGAGAPDPADFGGDIVAWVKDGDNFARLTAIITLTDPTGTEDGCNFDRMEFRFSKPMSAPGDTSTRLGAVEFTRLLRFVRLWRKVEWTIEQTDVAISALIRPDLAPMTADDVDTLAKLDTGFGTLIPRLGNAIEVLASLNLTAAKGLQSLLALWADIPAHGDTALYRTMFDTPSMLNQDPAFADQGVGAYLSDTGQHLLDHAAALRGAFSLSGDEFAAILAALGFDDTTPLSLPNISAVYRRGWLARALKLSVRELLLFVGLTGIDPFAAPDIGAAPYARPPILRFIDLISALKANGLRSTAALYLIWNQDLSGQSIPKPEAITAFARTLRADFNATDDQFAAMEDPNGDILQARMTLVYGQEAADAFIALLDNGRSFDVAYTHPGGQLEPAITALDPALGYDDFAHRLSHQGLLDPTMRDQLIALAGVAQPFKDAVGALCDASSDALASFFLRFPELRPLYDAYVASAQPPTVKRSQLLGDFQPELSRRRKSEQALDRLATLSGLTLDGVTALVAPSGGSPFPLHAVNDTARPALDDVLAIGSPGLSAQFYFRDTATGAVDATMSAVPTLDYPGSQSLPANPTPGSAVSGVWSGSVEIPESGYYNFLISADAAAQVRLELDGAPQPLTRNGALWRNSNALQMTAGALVPITLTVERVKEAVSLQWETPKQKRSVIPGRYLYSPAILTAFSATYIRLLKTATLTTTLGLGAAGMAHFGLDPDLRIGGDGWLNLLPISGVPSAATATALLAPLEALLGFSAIKATWSPDDDRLVAVLSDPAAAAAPDGLLFKLAQWDPQALSDILDHLGATPADLAHFALFERVCTIFDVLTAMRIPAASLIAATTNDPTADSLSGFQAALKARYAAEDWSDIVKPINDALRERQRDALVGYILQQFLANPPTPAAANIDTADKLFEYFLIDVEMASCKETSRIRLALSSIQLFIERCLMNLEADVSPASIDAPQWRWRKRYRLWQANREVFLFPENWLEPELRDDKSPFFKEIEGQLLQADITDDLAGQAVLTYLSRLSDVAHLVPCGMCIEEKNPGEGDDIVHVVARAGAGSTKFYYRRYEYGYWTAWEPIKLKIEDAPVIPVVWNNRLLLFWLNVLKQTPQAAPDPGTANADNGGTNAVADLSLTDVRKAAKNSSDKDVKVELQALLCWSEYYNGQWQPPQTSDVAQPADLGAYTPLEMTQLDRSRLTLRSSTGSDALLVSVQGAHRSATFRLYNTHSTPEIANLIAVILQNRSRTFGRNGSTFSITYNQSTFWTRPPTFTSLPRDVLTETIPMRIVEAAHNVSDIWNSPFFFEDRRSVFFVTTSRRTVWVGGFGGYGILPGVAAGNYRLPPIVLTPIKLPKPPHWVDPLERIPGAVDRAGIDRFMTADGRIRQGLATMTTVKFGDLDIGPAGVLAASAIEQ